jgi:hypothetical protein
MTKSIRDRMDNMFGVKRVNGEYVSKDEYNDHRNKRRDEILEEWIGKQESFEDRQIRLKKIDPFEVSDGLKNIDSKFCANVEEFANKNMGDANIKKSLKDEIAIFDNRLSISCSGRNIVRNFILERSNFLIKSNVFYIPRCENENDVSRWFEDNCNDLCLGIAIHRNRHSKFHIEGSGSYGGIDHICMFIDGISGIAEFHHCADNNYQPLLNRYMNQKQIMIYNQFYELVKADFMLIELEYLSSNFVRHKHPSVVDMVICYKKDRDLSVPVLELGIGDNK